MASIVFVAGLDDRDGDLNLEQQTKLIKDGYGSQTVEISSFRYNASDSNVLQAIDQSPSAHIILFSAGCSKSKKIANHLKSKNISLKQLHINEPYTCSAGTKDIVESTISLGVSASNVYSGGSDCTGNNIVGHTKLKGRKGHFESLTPLGKLVYELISSGPAPSNTSSPQSTTGNPESTVPPPPPPPPPRDKFAVKSKLTLKKASGPGEIVGVVEVDVVEGLAEFSGIQFSEPGDYVVEVIPSNTNDLIGTTFSVTVGEAELVEQPSVGEEPPVTGNRPIIAQIDEPRVKLKPMKHGSSDDNVDNQEISESIGMVPFVYFNGTQIAPKDIDVLDLYYEDCVPKMNLTFNDTSGQFRIPESNPIKNPKIELFLNSGSSVLKYIHLKFRIVSNLDKKNGLISIKCQLDLPDFYKSSFKSYKMTSFNALREFAKDMDLGYNSNITETDDEQVWSRKGGNGSDFIKEVFQHAYINDDTFVMSYIDYYYCLTFVDVQKEIERDISKDVGLASTGMSMAGEEKSEVEKLVPMVISNQHKGHVSPFTFIKIKVNNNTEDLKAAYGTQTESKSYDRIGKKFLVWVVDALTGDQNKNVETRTEDDIKTNTLPRFGGKKDFDNVHKNYAIAYEMQMRNFIMLMNNTAELLFPVPNFNIYKYQKINVVFVNTRTTATDPEDIEQRLTGEWIITDIGYTFRKGTLSQKVNIARRELSKTPEEMSREVVKPDNVNNSEINENPDVENQIVPNQTYSVGQRILVEQDSKRYIIEVTAILDNGVDIEGTITEFNTIGDEYTEVQTTENPETVPEDPNNPAPPSITVEQATANSKNGYTYELSEAKNSLYSYTLKVIIVKKDGKTVHQESNSSEPTLSISDLIYRAIAGAKDEMKSPETPATPADGTYIIVIAEPKTDNDQKISGNIKVNKIGPKRQAVGNITGFPDGGSIGPITGAESASEDAAVVAEMILRLEDEIRNKYNVEVKLAIKK